MIGKSYVDMVSMGERVRIVLHACGTSGGTHFHSSDGCECHHVGHPTHLSGTVETTDSRKVGGCLIPIDVLESASPCWTCSAYGRKPERISMSDLSPCRCIKTVSCTEGAATVEIYLELHGTTSL